MISETEFAELGDSLVTGFFIDKVVRALARTQRMGQLQGEDRVTIEAASRLLGQVVEGEKWLDERQFKAHSAETAVAFDRAVSALPLGMRAQSDFARYIQRVQGITSSLLDKGAAPSGKLKEVRDFFSRYGIRVFVEAQNIIGRSGQAERLRIWPRQEPETS